MNPATPGCREGGRIVVRTSPGTMVLGAVFSAFAVAMGVYLCAVPLGLVAVANPPASASARFLFLAAGAANAIPDGEVCELDAWP